MDMYLNPISHPLNALSLLVKFLSVMVLIKKNVLKDGMETP